MNAPYDFGRMPSADHRDADLLADLAKLTETYDQMELARRRGTTAFNRVLRQRCYEGKALQDRIAATPAYTPEGRRAKAFHAIREADPDAPSGGFTGMNAIALSALFDIIQVGAL